VAQFEKLWGDMTSLPELDCRFLLVPRMRGQQLKEPAQLDAWLRERQCHLHRVSLRVAREFRLIHGLPSAIPAPLARVSST